LWEREYRELRVRPSSTRMAPSKALVLFSALLDFRSMSRVLDMSCGTGRNAIFLARQGCEVHCLDFPEQALGRLHEESQKAAVEDKIRVYRCSLDTRLPFDGETFDFVLDSCVFCHFIGLSQREHYREEVWRS
jgi:2-polyprenyl-3-methyl-5-hydroxy-6-metoxy-1,4-benzoquinol methylase